MKKNKLTYNLKHDLHSSEIDLRRLEYLYGKEDCQEDILKLKGRIELLKEIIKEDKWKKLEKKK